MFKQYLNQVMKIKLILLILLALIQISLAQNISCSTDEKSLEKAHQIWEQAIIAKGGRERILSIKNMLSYDKRKNSVVLDVLPDKYWAWTEDSNPIGIIVSTENYSTNFGYLVKDDSYRPSYLVTETSKERRLAERLPSLLETKWIKPKLIGANTIIINKQPFNLVCVEITFRANQTDNKQITRKHDYIFDQKTHLLFRDIYYFDESIGGGYLTNEYSKYVDVKGVKFATKYTRTYNDKEVRGKGEFITDINVDYREDLFDKPPSIKDGPDGWKKKP